MVSAAVVSIEFYDGEKYQIHSMEYDLLKSDPDKIGKVVASSLKSLVSDGYYLNDVKYLEKVEA